MKTIISCMVLSASSAIALTFKMIPGSDLIGEITTTRVQSGESLADVGRRFGIGIYEMIEANPGINPNRPWAGSKLLVPGQFVLPHNRDQMIINLAEMRIYYFHPDNLHVSTFAIGIGRKDWETPLGYGTITQKTKNPSWRPPASIRAWYKENNMPLPDIVPPGPKNPLGKYAMRLSIPGYLIHGTNRPSGIGLRTSSGCIRLYPEDIETLFYLAPLGAKVQIINKPYKFGKHFNEIFLEAHEPLTGAIYQTLTEHQMLEEAILEAKVKNVRYLDNDTLRYVTKKATGIPAPIGKYKGLPK